MPRWAKVVIWAAVFALSAASGAWVASRTDPFPPGVDDPGARPTTSPTRTASPTQPHPVMDVAFSTTTEHRLHVGGSCRSDWHARFRITLQDDGSVEGDDTEATLVPGSAGCDFEEAQSQMERVGLAVLGTWERRGNQLAVSLRFRERGTEPPGSLDLGGFLPTVEVVRPVIEPQGDANSLGEERNVRVGDGNQGVYVAAYAFKATCRSGCG